MGLATIVQRREVVKTDCEVAMVICPLATRKIVEDVGRASGIVLLAPPNANEDIQDNIAD